MTDTIEYADGAGAPTLGASWEHHALAVQLLPDGLCSVNRGLDPPIVFHRTSGAHLWDLDGNRYIDYNCAFGATILGHCHPNVVDAVTKQLSHLDLIGLGSTTLEAELASKLVKYLPSAEMVTFLNSGTEATMLAIRIARAATGRSKIVKFQGCYHGWHDSVALNLISPASRIGQIDPLSNGILLPTLAETLVLPFNDCERLEDTIARCGDEIAAVIVEPIQHNVGCIEPTRAFLEALRTLTANSGIVLIFDEVVTAIRHSLSGYQGIANIVPDLTTVGKALGNGMPIAALVGAKNLMQRCLPQPRGDVLYAGTFNGTPVCLAAALATISTLENDESYRHLFELGETIRLALEDIVDRLAIPVAIAGFGSVWLPYFCREKPTRYEDLLASNQEVDMKFRRTLRDFGILTAPTAFKRFNLCLAHSEDDIGQTLEAVESAFRTCRRLL